MPTSSDVIEQYRRMMEQEFIKTRGPYSQLQYSPWSDALAMENAAGPRRERAPAKEPTTLTLAADPVDADYAALVAELGVNSGPVDGERFKTFLNEAGLHAYKGDEVQEYLHCKYKVPVGNITSIVTWGWRPLREQDRVISGAMDSKNGSIQRGVSTYSKPIPYPVLLTVKNVRDAFPTVRFYVSDEMQGERIPDPFLLVELAGQSFIIERWDEPAFRAKK